MILLVSMLAPVLAAPEKSVSFPAQDKTLASLFPEEDAHAVVRDGPLFGEGRERIVHRVDGGLHIERIRHYTKIRHPKTGKVLTLPHAWEARAVLEVSPSLRLMHADTSVRLHPSANGLVEHDVLQDAYPYLFDVDHTVIGFNTNNQHLTYQAWSDQKLQVTKDYAYDSEAVPIDVVGLHLSRALLKQRRKFEFELLLPDGGNHSIRAEVHRTRDLRSYAKDYPIQASRLRTAQKVIVVDLRLDSPFKYVFFPHHFYFVFSVKNTSHLLMLWGGDPDDPMLAFRIP